MYYRVLILALSPMTPRPGFAADVTCVTSRYLLPSSPLRHTSSRYREPPYPLGAWRYLWTTPFFSKIVTFPLL